MGRRCIGLDVHRDFCEVAIWEDGRTVSAGRVPSRPAALKQFAADLHDTDEVAMEATSGARQIAELIAPHVSRVVIANTHRLAAIAASKKKTDRNDARTLAQVLAAEMLEESWLPSDEIRGLRRRVSRRHNLVVARTRVKNEIAAVLHRNLCERPPMADVFGVEGRHWLAALDLPNDEVETVGGALRQIDFFTGEIQTVEREIAKFVAVSADARRLMTVPGVGMITAATFCAQAGPIARFSSPRSLVGYLGLDPRVRQSGNSAAVTGRISKEGSAIARHMLVESAHSAVRTAGPIRAFYERVRARRGHSVAIVATARKMVTIFWTLLTKGEDYRHSIALPTRKKLRKVELLAGGLRLQGGGNAGGPNREERFRLDQERVRAAEADYVRLVADRAKPVLRKATSSG